MASLAISIFSAAALILLAAIAIREHRVAMARRRVLLAEASALLRDAKLTHAPDNFPVVSGRMEDGRNARIELLAYTMVTRRLPQLWLKVTIAEAVGRDGPSIGALARPTGAEYYSLVHDLPEWMTPPETGAPLLMRGDGKATSAQVAAVARHFRLLFADPKIKEAVITPRVSRLFYQAAQGERSAHLFLRQARFSLTAVPAETIRLALLEATKLSTVLDDVEQAPASRAA